MQKSCIIWPRNYLFLKYYVLISRFLQRFTAPRCSLQCNYVTSSALIIAFTFKQNYIVHFSAELGGHIWDKKGRTQNKHDWKNFSKANINLLEMADDVKYIVKVSYVMSNGFCHGVGVGLGWGFRSRLSSPFGWLSMDEERVAFLWMHAFTSVSFLYGPLLAYEGTIWKGSRLHKTKRLYKSKIMLL